MLKNIFPILFLVFISCNQQEKALTDYVNTFVGTGGHGHTYPGASVPFGMVQLSPDTRLEGWDGCGGYHYSDSIIYGFSHTHLSGTGVSDYGDILIMPIVGDFKLNNGANGEVGYCSIFSHKEELTEPGYYKVRLKDYNINVELTTTNRVGFHRYEFPKDKEAKLILDLDHRDKLLEYNIEYVDSNIIQGIRYSDNWAKKQKVHFYIEFSENIESIIYNNRKTVAGFDFGNINDPLLVKVGISAVSKEGAKNNLETETPHFNFDRVKLEAKEKWNTELNKIIVDGGSEVQKEIFYTALYHSFLAPNLYIDVNGKYNGTDLKNHHTDDKHYTVFSLWDTFRATHPLFTLVQNRRTGEFIRTLLRQYKEGGKLPIWELAGNYTGCMIGYHAIPVIVDAFIKGIKDFDYDLALEAMIHSANQDSLGLKSYKDNGFISASEEPESVSKNLEYAYDDWCIAHMADQLGDTINAKNFYIRAQNYKNIFDPSSGFFRAKRNYSWFSPFIPEEVNFNYTEANAWQYSLFVPQDIEGHIDLMGGSANFENHLDRMFEASNITTGREQPDITGLIGQYAHGNEPSHHMGYLYNYVGKPFKTQKIIRQILDEQYTNMPDGLSGNEDCGQMSSWYVLSAIGLYSVTPGLDYYTIGTPIFEHIKINLENGNLFRITANNVSEKNIYIQSATLNGIEFNQSFINHQSIMDGGVLIFEMGSTPSNWASKSIPPSNIDKFKIVPVPYFVAKSQTFSDKIEIELGSVIAGDIYYSINGGEEIKYVNKIIVSEDSEIKCRTFKDKKWSKSVTANYYKIDNRKSIEIKSKYENQYSAAGDKSLIDYQRGGRNYRTGNWQGYRGDLDAIVDLGQISTINTISIGCLQDIRSWIFYPRNVEFYISNDGEQFELVEKINNTFPDTLDGSFINDYIAQLNDLKARYIQVKAENYGYCPAWHLGAGGKAWLFVDELIIE